MASVSRRSFVSGVAGTTAALLTGRAGLATAKRAVQDEASEMEPRHGGTLRIGLRVDVGTLDPHNMRLSGDADYNFNIYNGLVGLNPQFEPVPELAESWETPDDTTYIFHLRTGVTFHDGTPFNGEAVKFNIERLLDPAEQATHRIAFENIENVEVIDDHTVKVSLNQIDTTLLSSFGWHSALIVSPSAVEEWGEEYPLHPVGTGPFRFVEYVSDDHLTLERNPDYWEEDEAGNQLPYLDGLEYRIIPDETVRLANIEAGTLDFMTVVPHQDVQRLRDSTTLKFMEGPSQAVYTLRINNNQPPFDNEHLRRAVAWGIDRQAIGEVVFFGVGSPAVNALSPAQWGFAPEQFDYVSYEYDPAKVREELELGGQPNGFEFQFETRNQPTFIQFAEAVAAQLSEVGIMADVVVKEQVTSLEDMRAGNFEMATGRDTGAPDPVGGFVGEFHCGTVNLAGPYCNPEFDDLIERTVAEPDREQKLDLLAEAADFVNSQALRIYVWNDVETAAMREEVMGYVHYGHGKMKLVNVWMHE